MESLVYVTLDLIRPKLSIIRLRLDFGFPVLISLGNLIWDSLMALTCLQAFSVLSAPEGRIRRNTGRSVGKQPINRDQYIWKIYRRDILAGLTGKYSHVDFYWGPYRKRGDLNCKLRHMRVISDGVHQNNNRGSHNAVRLKDLRLLNDNAYVYTLLAITQIIIKLRTVYSS